MLSKTTSQTYIIFWSSEAVKMFFSGSLEFSSCQSQNVHPIVACYKGHSNVFSCLQSCKWGLRSRKKRWMETDCDAMKRWKHANRDQRCDTMSGVNVVDK